MIINKSQASISPAVDSKEKKVRPEIVDWHKAEKFWDAKGYFVVEMANCQIGLLTIDYYNAFNSEKKWCKLHIICDANVSECADYGASEITIPKKLMKYIYYQSVGVTLEYAAGNLANYRNESPLYDASIDMKLATCCHYKSNHNSSLLSSLKKLENEGPDPEDDLCISQITRLDEEAKKLWPKGSDQDVDRDDNLKG
jgi:hypothetical protein